MQKDPLYIETIPVFIRFLGNLSDILEIGKKSRIAEGKLLEGRLAPDMYNLKEQVGYVYFMALECAQNLSGKAGPEMGYDEKSIKELRASLARVIAFLKTVKPKDYANVKSKRVRTFLVSGKTVARDAYVRELALPNFYFHVTTAYDIMRHLGVPLKKGDYLGKR